LICGYARVRIAAEIVEPLVEDCFLLRCEVRVLDLNGAPD
jgi:hypothetical protein